MWGVVGFKKSSSGETVSQLQHWVGVSDGNFLLGAAIKEGSRDANSIFHSTLELVKNRFTLLTTKHLKSL